MSLNDYNNGKEVILELIKCPICLEIFNDPRMLPCQHSFCRSCLERLAENDGRWGRCPQCRQLFRIPFNGVGSFDVNRTIAQLLDTFPKQMERPVLKAKCGCCRKEEIITTCEHCKEALCKPCRMNHFNEVKNELSKKIIKIDKEADNFHLKETECISKHESNLAKCKEIRLSIQKKCNDLIQQIKDEETKLLDDVDDFERTETNYLQDKYNKIKEFELMIKYSSKSEKILTNKEETDQEITEMTENCDKYIEIIKEFTKNAHNRYMNRKISFFNRDVPDSYLTLGYVETLSQHDGSSFIFEEDQNEEKFETLEMQLKQVPKRPMPPSIRRSKYHTPANFSTKLPSRTRFKSIIEPRKLSTQYKIVGSEGEGPEEFKHPLGVSVSPIDGNIYVADSWNNRIQVFDENGNFIRSIDRVGESEFHYPYSIHIDKKGRIYISDQSSLRIKVFDSQFSLLRVIGSYGREIGCYSGLCDISTDYDNNIYICDSGNHRILKFSENGDFLMQWGSNGSSEGMFKCPACVTVHEDKVIVSDWGNHRVQIFTLDGKFLKQIGKQGNGPSEFKRPLGVAVDEKGNIAIVDEGNNRLQIFRSDFSYFSKVTGLKLEFQRPWDVAITRNGGIVVSEYYGHRLQIL